MRRHLGLSLALCALVMAGAALADSVPGLRTVHARPALVSRNAKFTVSGQGCLPGDQVELLSRLFPNHAFGLVGDELTEAKSNGAFARTIKVPAKAKSGQYTISVRCGGGNLGVSTTVRVR